MTIDNESPKKPEIGKHLAWIAKATGRVIKNSSPEAKATGIGAVVSGTGIAATGIGTHIGIAALGSAVSGVVVLPLIAAAFGGIGSYSLYKKYKEGAKKPPEKSESQE